MSRSARSKAKASVPPPPRRGRSRTRGAGTRGATSEPVTANVPIAVAPAEPLLRIRGARTHNLRDIDVDLPRNKLVVVTGPSGSGKSSLAFDTIFAEGQRRYVESLSVQARQFLSQLPKPDVDLIEGLSPAVAISQDNRARHPRSTVGTVTEIYDYLRLLYAKVGEVFSHQSGKPMRRHTIEEMVDAILELPEGTRLSILAPVAVNARGDHRELLEDLRRRGFSRVAIDDTVRDLSETVDLDPLERHTIEVYVDRLKLKEGIRSRVAESVELAVGLTDGQVRVLTVEGQELRFSERWADFEHGVAYPDVTPSLFSFNSPHGACPRCDGLGYQQIFDPRRIVPDASAAVATAIRPAQQRGGSGLRKRIAEVLEHLGIASDAPWSSLDAEVKIALLEGTGDEVVPELGKPFEGVSPWLRRRLEEARARSTGDDEETGVLAELEEFLGEVVCPECQGTRLRIEARMVRVGGRGIHEMAALPLRELIGVIEGLELSGEAGEVGATIVDQVSKRLRFLIEVGVGYLTLDRPANTLSGGESQRIRLATQVGAALVGITYILDEPSIGLHQRDNDRLIATLSKLRDLGNSVIVVEHDEDTMRAADWIVDMGPGAGRAGGRVVAAGPLEVIVANKASPTGNYLSGRTSIPVPSERRRSRGPSLVIKNARGHNLAGVTARIPLQSFTCVTGVSGSGKSSLIIDTLLPEAVRVLNRGSGWGLDHDAIEGLDHLDKVIYVDQSPIGRSARSNPATYTGIFAEIRNVFAELPEARMRGYKPPRFSFNVKGGRCEACQGEGVKRIEMHFLPDIHVTCDKCGGRRYNRETLAITMRGKNIADVLDLSVAEACEFFVSHPDIRQKLEVLRDVGLGYVALGQSALTLSGGEAQRIKLARELARKSTGKTLFVLDEPTTGLHFGDIRQLLNVLQRLVDEGNTVVVIEHDLHVIKCADYVIDLGPEGGDRGGRLVVSGTPEHVARHATSYTGHYLRRVLGSRPSTE